MQEIVSSIVDSLFKWQMDMDEAEADSSNTLYTNKKIVIGQLWNKDYIKKIISDQV